MWDTGSNRAAPGVLACVLSGTLTGCWAPPRADVHPPGPPHVIARTVGIDRHRDGLIVRGVDPAARTIALAPAKNATALRYRVEPDVGRLSAIRPGDTVEASVSERLIISAGDMPAAAPAAARGAGTGAVEAVVRASVLTVDRSYRLLKVQVRSGGDETFKLPLGLSLREVRPGDEVAVSPIAVRALRLQRRGAAR